MVFSRSCPGCGGTGQQRPRPCEPCGGAGQLTRAEAVQVRIPAGVADGARVRVPGKGNAGLRGGDAGDLYITVQVAPHPLYRREGDDLLHHRADRDSRGGARRAHRRADARRRRRGCACRRGRSRASGSGCASAASPSTRDGRRGDLVVEVRLVLPKLLDERSKELLREFGRINGENVRDVWRDGPRRHGDTEQNR